MLQDKTNESVLPPYRVLDLTEGGCLLGGRLLGDLGADVIKIEAPHGSPSRIAPYYKGIADPEKSLFWFAYNANKRGITLDITKKEGQEIFLRLAKTSDIILESFEPGYLSSLKLSYSDLCLTKQDIIMTSITPFGQEGPKAHFKGSDLTAWASGGYLYACGNPDRAPVWISFPQSSLFGGAEGAIGALIAVRHRQNTGEGQHVDVSLQECAVSPNLNVLQMWDVSKVEFHRVGGALFVPSTGVRQPIYFRCQDGYVMILVQGGNEPFVSSSIRLVKWMAEENMAPEWLTKLDWIVDYDANNLGQATADKVGEAIEKFTSTKSKNELYEEGAFRRQILLAPISTTRDISEDIQLEARNYWAKQEHPELREILTYCGPFVNMSETPLEYRRRAPLIGEHNEEIYLKELGISDQYLRTMQERGII
jgi:crotonobetainyl-CoA:carnitine CoA-transferase CaiB-like acyl-CoA transferase